MSVKQKQQPKDGYIRSLDKLLCSKFEDKAVDSLRILILKDMVFITIDDMENNEDSEMQLLTMLKSVGMSAKTMYERDNIQLAKFGLETLKLKYNYITNTWEQD